MLEARSSKDEKLSLANLMLISFPTSSAEIAIAQLRDRCGVVAIQSCARQIWIGRKQDFSSISDYLSSGTFTTGTEAYIKILELVTGVSSEREWDKESAGQTNRGWDSFSKSHPMKSVLFETFRQGIVSDSRLILREILSGIKPRGDEIIARLLSGYKPFEDILIVTERSRGGTLSGVTDRMVRTMSNKPHTAREITITHPDDKVTYNNLCDIFDLHMRGIVNNTVSPMPFDEIEMAFDSYDRIYIDLPMGSHPDAEQRMIDAWKNRVKSDNVLTHLRGRPEDGYTNEAWKCLSDRKDTVLPESIRMKKEIISLTNEKLLISAREAFVICAEQRLNGAQPSLRHLKAQMSLPLLEP